MQEYKGYYKSNVGWLEIICTKQGLIAINFVDEGLTTDSYALVDEVIKQLDEYFNGKRKNFDLPLYFEGTKFQKEVWTELINIPYGKTVSYKDIAIAIKHDKAVRAVGTTNSKNKIPIVIPCHRVIGHNGKLSGYAGGVWRKEKLLQNEEAAGI
ncbi:MAG: methylated-DNA--[protein]-cysteine S-methyltransferase [bacterium]